MSLEEQATYQHFGEQKPKKRAVQDCIQIERKQEIGIN